MWNAAKRRRIEELRKREETAKLSPRESAELAGFIKELERHEAGYLGPATRRLQAERNWIQKKNRAIERLVRRKQSLKRRLEAVLAEADAECKAIDSEVATIVNADGPVTSVANPS